MAAKKRGLNRGLDELLGRRGAPAPTAGPRLVETEPSSLPREGLRELPLEKIRPGKYQPRESFDQQALEELARSIEANGVVQPIVVRERGAGEYELVAGERRWRAAQLARLASIPAVIRDVSDRRTLAIALIENVQREDLNPLEESGALQRLLMEFQMTHREVADAVGRSRTAVTNLLRLQDLEEPCKAHLLEGRLEMGHARALLSLRGADQQTAAQEVIRRKLSVRATEALVRNWGEEPEEKLPRAATKDPDIVRLENELSEKLCARVAINHSAKGKGKLSIQYNSLDELEGILEHLRDAEDD